MGQNRTIDQGIRWPEGAYPSQTSLNKANVTFVARISTQALRVQGDGYQGIDPL